MRRSRLLAPERAPASAIVLAGGRSTRMGRPKATLLFDGCPLLVHIVDRLHDLFDEVVVVAARDQPLPDLAATVVRDAVAAEGPARGLYGGLCAVHASLAFVSSCDAVSLNTRLIAHLVTRSAGYDIVVPRWAGRDQPLHAVYRTTVAPTLAELLAAGDRRPASLFPRVRTCRIDPDEIRTFDPDGRSFTNMNTPADYARAVLQWHDPTAGVRQSP